jgi:hypothetical protein
MAYMTGLSSDLVLRFDKQGPEAQAGCEEALASASLENSVGARERKIQEPGRTSGYLSWKVAGNMHPTRTDVQVEQCAH